MKSFSESLGSTWLGIHVAIAGNSGATEVDAIHVPELASTVGWEDLVNEVDRNDWTRTAVRLDDARVPRQTESNANASRAPSTDTVAELTALRAHVSQLERRLEHDVCALRARVDMLESLVVRANDHDESPFIDPFSAWIEGHSDELAKYPNSWIAASLEKGIIIHETDGDVFMRRLDALPPEERERVLTFHAAMFL